GDIARPEGLRVVVDERKRRQLEKERRRRLIRFGPQGSQDREDERAHAGQREREPHPPIPHRRRPPRREVTQSAKSTVVTAKPASTTRSSPVELASAVPGGASPPCSPRRSASTA